MRDWVRAGAKRLHGPRFLLVLVLTAWGSQTPTFKEKEQSAASCLEAGLRKDASFPAPLGRAGVGRRAIVNGMSDAVVGRFRSKVGSAGMRVFGGGYGEGDKGNSEMVSPSRSLSGSLAHPCAGSLDDLRTPQPVPCLVRRSDLHANGRRRSPEGGSGRRRVRLANRARPTEGRAAQDSFLLFSPRTDIHQRVSDCR
jgi:hypothetical protein